jgi:two-component sensor histidine kinase
MTPAPALPFVKIAVAYAAWWLLWLAAQTLLLQETLDINIAWRDALVTQLITAMAGYAINTSMHAYQPSGRNAIFVFVQSLILAGVAVAVMRWVLRLWIPDEQDYLIWLDMTVALRFGYAWLMLLLVAVLTWFWVFIADSAESSRRKEAATKLARDAELANLRRQLQPHFLFNSLNSISALAGHQPEQARLMVQQLSDFLRGTLRQDDQSLVSLDEELQHLNLYLAIEKVRFGHRLQTAIQIDENARSSKLPSLILQPILENAIKYGLYDTTGDTIIAITATREDRQLIIRITNPYDSTTVTSRPGTGFGLSSVQRRLDLLYLRNDLLTIHRGEQSFITTVHIPQ